MIMIIGLVVAALSAAAVIGWLVLIYKVRRIRNDHWPSEADYWDKLLGEALEETQLSVEKELVNLFQERRHRWVDAAHAYTGKRAVGAFARHGLSGDRCLCFTGIGVEIYAKDHSLECWTVGQDVHNPSAGQMNMGVQDVTIDQVSNYFGMSRLNFSEFYDLNDRGHSFASMARRLMRRSYHADGNLLAVGQPVESRQDDEDWDEASW